MPAVLAAALANKGVVVPVAVAVVADANADADADAVGARRCRYVEGCTKVGSS